MCAGANIAVETDRAPSTSGRAGSVEPLHADFAPPWRPGIAATAAAGQPGRSAAAGGLRGPSDGAPTGAAYANGARPSKGGRGPGRPSKSQSAAGTQVTATLMST